MDSNVFFSIPTINITILRVVIVYFRLVQGAFRSCGGLKPPVVF